MTEQEKRRRRREAERRMRQRQAARGGESEGGGLLQFRIYVTAVLVGGCLLISLFQTETSERVCAEVKQRIAAQTDMAAVQAWKERAATLLRDAEIALPSVEEEADPKPQYQPDTENAP